MRETPAEHARHRFLNLFFAGLRILVEKRFGGQNHAAQAKSALRGILVDKGLLNGVRFFDRAQAFESRNFHALHGLDRSDAGADRLALYNHGAGSALAEAAAEFRAAQLQIVAQGVQKRRCGIKIQGVSLAVDLQRNRAHMLTRYCEDTISSRAGMPLPAHHSVRRKSSNIRAVKMKSGLPANCN